MRNLASRRLVRAGVTTYIFSALTLLAHLVSGVVTARALGPSGRGVTVALTTLSQLAGFLFAMGVAQSLSYYIARRPEDGPALFTTWVVMLLPLTALALVIAELLLPVIFSGPGGEQAVMIGRWFLITIVVVVGLELNYGLLLGTQDFFAYNVLRFAQPALIAVALVVLWGVDLLTVESALISATVALPCCWRWAWPAACAGSAWAASTCTWGCARSGTGFAVRATPLPRTSTPAWTWPCCPRS